MINHFFFAYFFAVHRSFRRGNFVGAYTPRANALKGSWGPRGLSSSHGHIFRGRSSVHDYNNDKEAAADGVNDPQEIYLINEELNGLVQRQKNMLQHQYQQVEKLRKQLEELDEVLSALQLQTNALNRTQGVSSFSKPVTKQNEGSKELRISCSQPPEGYEEDEGFSAQSLDPRDYP